MKIVAGWTSWTRETHRLYVFDTLEAAIEAHSEVFGGCYSEEFTESLGIKVRTVDAGTDDEHEELAEPLTLDQARRIVTYVNSEGNYVEFIFRPAWPDEEASGRPVDITW